MKIAIYINNSNISNVDCSDLTKGNPGIGGTEYCILLLAQLYKRYYPDNQITLIASSKGILPEVDDIVIENNLFAVPQTAKSIAADVLVVSSVFEGKPLPIDFFSAVEAEKIKTITWGHNFYLNDFCNLLVKNDFICANVFVGHQQYDRYIDHEVIRKSTYIYNMYPEVSEPFRKENDGKTVTYIGSLVPTKGFHLLANAWKAVLVEVPDAQLHVVGSGKLYDRNSKLGSYGIAEESYENSFIKGITDRAGELLPSVHFHGVMGEEKKELIARTSVGVANPSGRTETFGISAIDFSSRGVPVVTIASGGFLDTVENEKTGLLYNDTKDLAGCIVRLLKEKEFNEKCGEYGKEYSKQYTPEKLIVKWHEVFELVLKGKRPAIEMPTNFMKNNLKQFRILNRKIKNFLHWEYPVSVIGIETIGRNLLRRLGH